MRDYALLLYIQVITTQNVLKGSAKILYVRHQAAARDMSSIIHSVTVYKCKNHQALSNFSVLAFYQFIMVPGKQGWTNFITFICILWLLAIINFAKSL